MEIKIEILVRTHSPPVAKALYDSLKPDNVNFPRGLSMTMALKGSTLMLRLKTVSRIDTLISTVDDVFEACAVCLDGISSTERLNHR
jgi:tRNA threonylcarbamoyladenosine modification (KEOPS) complex  Pcc1 subunit